jgi:hypothetical protein
MSDLLRAYAPDECGPDGYPLAWHESIKHMVRADADHRCVRCGHPYRTGQNGSGEWSPCDERCTHKDKPGDWRWGPYGTDEPESRWRILTVHHLDGDKRNCRWWNLCALCQRCHLTVQGKVVMDRRWHHEHSPWFRPYVAGYYAHAYLGQDVTREEAEVRVDELLALEIRQEALL